MKRRFYVQFIIVSLAIMAGMTMKSYALEVTVATQEGVNLVYELNEESKDCSVSRIENFKYRGSITVPSTIEYEGKQWNVTSIYSYAFEGSYISAINITEGVHTIGRGAFSNCQLQSICIPKSLKTIEDEAFERCPLSSVYITDLGAWCNKSGRIGAIYGIPHLYLNGVEIRDLVIPNDVETISEHAFQSCKGLTSVTIPDNVTSIERSAFSYCTNLTCVIMGNGVTSIGQGAFSNCDSLTDVMIGKSVTSIDLEAFYGCSGLKSIAISNNVTSIGSNAFKYCSNLERVINLSNVVLDFGSEVKQYNIDNLIDAIIPNHTYTYSGVAPELMLGDWVPDVSISSTFDSSKLATEAGQHSVVIPIVCNYTTPSFEKEYLYEYTITKKDLKVTSHSSRSYGEENPFFPMEYEGFVNNETESVISVRPIGTTNAKITSTVGTYPITISGGMATNYEFIYETGALTVTKAVLSAKVKDATRTYGAQNPTFTMEYYGLKNDEKTPTWSTQPTFQTEATQYSDVGQYEITASSGIAVNYELSEIVPGTLTIKQAPLTIRANHKEKQYYSENPMFSYTCYGFKNGEDNSVLTKEPQLSSTATFSSKVGRYEIEVSDATSPNYSISFVNGTLTITPRTLTASVGNYSRFYNEENPTFEVQYSGFVGGEDESVIKTKATASTTATKTSDVGTYPIQVTGGSADNYNFSYTSGTLTIDKAEQTLSWEQDLTNLKVGDQVELKATASSGLPITYMMDSSSQAEIYTAGTKTYLDCLSSGNLRIRAVQDGNQNYDASPRASQAIIIKEETLEDQILTIIQADNGSISTKVGKGRKYTFTITAWEGWNIHSVSYNDEDVTGQLDETGTFTTPAINENATLIVAYEEDGGNAVKALSSSPVRIQGTSFGARVTGVNHGDVIQVYTLDGVLQKSIKADNHVTDILLTEQKIYIIKAGNKTVKLSI